MSSSISISERYDETYALQLLRYFNEHTKLNNISPAIFVILKDKVNDISEDISSSSIFSINKKNVYVTSKVINSDYNEQQLQSIENKMKQIISNANTKYNQWITMKLDKEVDKLKPLFLALWSNYIEPTMKSTQGSPNTCLGQCYTDYVWFPLMFITVCLICLFTYPSLYIYDYLSGRSKELTNIIQAKVKIDGYQYTEQIDLYIYEELKSLSSEIKVPNVKLESGVVLYNYVVVDSGVDGDSVLKHVADKFVLQFVHSNNDVIVSVNELYVCDNNDNSDNSDNSNYKELPTNDV